MKSKIRYTRDAVDDLDSIFDYIAEGNRIAAGNMLEKIERTIMSLANNPRMGTVLPAKDLSLVESGYRKIIIKPFIVFYRIGKEEIYIARVLHSKQDWLHLLFENNYDEV